MFDGLHGYLLKLFRRRIDAHIQDEFVAGCLTAITKDVVIITKKIFTQATCNGIIFRNSQKTDTEDIPIRHRFEIEVHRLFGDQQIAVHRCEIGKLEAMVTTHGVTSLLSFRSKQIG